MRTRLWLCAAIFAVSCTEQGADKKTEPQAKPSGTEGAGGEMKKEAPKPAPVKKTAADFVKDMEVCNAAMLAKDDAKLAACYTDDAKASIVDSGMDFTGGKAIVEGLYKPWFTAMPDFTPKPQLVIASGNQMVAVMHGTGTNSGPMMGMPASNKPVKMLGARYIAFADDGKMKEDWHVADMTTVLHQIGALPKGTKLPMPPRVDEKPLFENVEVAVATDSKTEADNVALIAKLDDAYVKSDWKTLGDAMTDDFTYVDNGMPGEMKGKEANVKMLEAMGKAFTDKKFESVARFGAGDYVASVGIFTGTNSGDMPMMKLKKTGKTITGHSIGVFHIKGGKVAKMWAFGNGLPMWTQLGIIKMPAPPAEGGAAPPAEGGEKPAKPGKKAPPTP